MAFIIVRCHLMPPSVAVSAQRNEIGVALAKKVVVVEVVDLGGEACAVKRLATMNGSQIGEPTPSPVNAG